MKRVLSLLALGLAGVSLLEAAAPPPVSSGPVVDLPPMLVEGTGAKGPHWRYAIIPGFEILSCADDESTADFTLKLWRLDTQLRALVPAALLARGDEPATLIFYPQSRAESLSREMMAELDRVQVGSERPDRVKAPPNLDLRDADSSMLFSVIEDKSTLNGWRILHGGSEDTKYGDLALSAEHVRSLIQDRAPSPPPWFAAGFSRFYATLWDNDQGMHFAPDPWLGPDEARAVKNRPDALRPTLPLAELLTGRFPRLGADAPSRAYRQLWLAEAELFIRWCLDGKTVAGGSARDALWQFADAASRQPVTEALFRRYFGLGFSDARDELSDYLATAVARPMGIHLDTPSGEPEIRLYEAPPEIIHRIKGDWSRRTLRLVRENYPKLLPIYAQQARDMLQKAYDRSERDPRLVADLGLLYCDIGDYAAARRYLEEAFRSGPIRPAALAQLAQRRLADAGQRPAGGAARLSESQAESVLTPIRAARKVFPPQLITYSVASEIVRLGPDPPSAETRAILAEGAALFPAVSPLILSSAVEEARAGDSRRAVQLAELGMWTASDRAWFERLKSVRNASLPKPTK